MDSELDLRSNLDVDLRKLLVLTAGVPILVIGVLAVGALAFLGGTSGTRVYGIFALLGLVASLVVAYRTLSAVRAATSELTDSITSLATAQASLTTSGSDQALTDWGPQEVPAGSSFAPAVEALNELQTNSVKMQFAQQDAVKKGISGIVINMARRSQTLLDRQVEFIDKLENSEEDPDRLEELFKVDHLATRMRRNAESLLVLAQADPGRRRGGPVEISDVLRVAIGEIENYLHIELGSIEDGKLSASAAVDVAHLSAELMENAAQFSPPESPVLVSGDFTQSGDFVISIVDHGMGMNDEQLARSNDTLADPPELGLDLGRSLGFVVVGRLAGRLGARVNLAPTPGKGTTATITLGKSLIVGDQTGRPAVAKPKPETRSVPAETGEWATAAMRPQAHASAPAAESVPAATSGSASSPALSRLLGLEPSRLTAPQGDAEPSAPVSSGANDQVAAPADWASRSPFAPPAKEESGWKPPEVTPDAPLPNIPGVEFQGETHPSAEPVPAHEVAETDEELTVDPKRMAMPSGRDRGPAAVLPPATMLSGNDDFLSFDDPSKDAWTPPAVAGDAAALPGKAPKAKKLTSKRTAKRSKAGAPKDEARSATPESLRGMPSEPPANLEEAIPSGDAFDEGMAGLLDTDERATTAAAAMREPEEPVIAATIERDDRVESAIAGAPAATAGITNSASIPDIALPSRAAKPTGDASQPGGLTKRRRGATSPADQGPEAGGSKSTPAKASSRDPEEIRSMLSRYRQGLKGGAVSDGTDEATTAADAASDKEESE